MNRKMYLKACVLSAIVGVTVPAAALAQGDPLGVSKGGDLGLPSISITQLIINVINFLLGLSAILALAAIIIGGIMYIISLGNEKRAETAKNIVLYAIIGLIVIGASYTILSVVKGFFNPPSASGAHYQSPIRPNTT